MPTITDLINGEAQSVNSEVKSPQTVARAEVASWCWARFRELQMMRDQKQELFRDRTLKEWVDDNVKRFIQFKRRPAHKKPWQSNLASSTPNEKLIGILSKLATQGVECKVRSLEDYSVIEQFREKISNSLLKSAAIKNEDDFQIVLEMLEAAEKGTVIGFEDWYHGKRQIREVIDQDVETGELKFKVKTIKEWNDVRSSLVNIQDFYPGNLMVRPGKIQDMDDCFLRRIMTEDEFEAEYGKFKDADKVTTKRAVRTNESTPFWVNGDDVAIDQVEVILYFNKKTDEFLIVANEIWINPVGAKTISPLPWNHKQLPFWAAVFEPLDANYFYGRSFIDKLISMCDAKDALFDRILDQMTLAVSKPIITDGQTSSALTKGFLQPNNVITTDWTNGRPNFELVPIQDPSPVGVTLYQLLQQNLEQAGPAAETIGGRAPGKKTATQANIENEGAMQIVSLFLSMMQMGIRDKNKLRFPNMLQFYTLPVNGKDGERFKKVVLRNEELSTGKQGTLSIEINPNQSQGSVMKKAENNLQPVEFIEVTPDFIRLNNWMYELEIVPQSSVKMTEQQRQILEMNYQRIMLEMYPDKFNRDAGFEELNVKFGKDPSKMKAKTPTAEQDMGMGGSLKDMMSPQQSPMMA